MQTCEPESPHVAPGPTIPTYRPSSQSYKRTHYTISALAPRYQQCQSNEDDIRAHSSLRSSNGNSADGVHFLQAHTSLQGASQSTGAREMIKAGQKRLRLALRNKKGSDANSKTDNASHQLGMLQQEGYSSRTLPRRIDQKGSVGSTSISKSFSDLSFKSNSNAKRDVETMGRPWLEHPLERDTRSSNGSSQLSSLDLRDLASFVEAAVNFSPQSDDSIPPPYPASTGQPPNPALATTCAPERILRSDTSPISISGDPGSSINGDASRSKDELPASLQINVPSQSNTNGEHNRNQTSEQVNRREKSKKFARLSPPNSFADYKTASAPKSPVLKLFPDTTPPRVSSRGALHVPTARAPTPIRSFSPTSDSQRNATIAAVLESNGPGSNISSNSLPDIQEDVPGSPAEEQSTSMDPGRASDPRENSGPDVTQSTNPFSLPKDTIDAFPIPAPTRALPSVPQPAPLRINRSERSSLDQQAAQADPTRPGIEPAGLHNSVSKDSSQRNNNKYSYGRSSPHPNLLIGTRDPVFTQEAAAAKAPPAQCHRSSLGKTGRCREEKVRSLIMRDLAASRRPKSSSKNQITETQQSEAPKEQVSQLRRHDESRPPSQRQYQRKVSPGPSSAPPKSPPPPHPPRQPPSRRYCTSPSGQMGVTFENSVSALRPASNRHARVYRQSSVRSVESGNEKAVMDQDVHGQETPLPSSDDEGPDAEFYWNSSQRISGRCRRTKPAPLVIDEPASGGLPLKKHLSFSDVRPPTPPLNHRRRAPETTCLTHNSPHGQHYRSHDCHASESKSNTSLEGRVEHLERQNKILQAALFAALDVGVQQDLSSIFTSFSTTPTPPLTGSSVSSTTNIPTPDIPSEQPRRACHDILRYHPGSWAVKRDSFGSDYSAQTEELEEMIDEFDLDWISEHSSIMGKGSR
ncbi:hypothetical protein BJX61DRAFT_240313 [Aspergillus egyptiacus]|nr:hypothetical protein BJX61DRAFT_240313 [Aspergillus egyptiacus]